MQAREPRRPGELAFAAFLAAASLFLLWSAYGISGFTALSGPGAIPMAATLAMAVTALIVLIRSARAPADTTGAFLSEVLPARIAVVGAMLVAYAFALRPLGFLPTSALFLVLAIRYLSRRSWGFALGTGLLSLIVIYLVFRIVFTVLMPAGIVPEGEMLAAVRRLFAGGK